MSVEDIKSRLKGVFAFPITPYKPEDWSELDEEGLRENIRFLVKNGVYNIVPCGGTGEIDYLTEKEHLTATSIVLEEAGDKALVVPTLPGSIKRSIEFAEDLNSLGADIFLAFPPPSDEAGILSYYRALSDRVEGFLMLYNRRGDWSLELISKLAEIKNVVAIKDEKSDLGKFYEIVQLVGDKVVLIGGIDHTRCIVPYYFMVGMKGFTCGLINFMPKPELEIYEAAVKKDYDRVVEIQKSLGPIFSMRKRFGHISMVKEAMNLVGLHGGSHRPPQRPLTEEQRNLLKGELERLGLIKA